MSLADFFQKTRFTLFCTPAGSPSVYAAHSGPNHGIHTSRLFLFSACVLLICLTTQDTWADPLVLTQAWSVPIDGPSDCAPALADDGTIYFGTWLGTLWAVTPKGAKKWTFHADREIKSSPAIADDGTIYFGCRDRKLYAVNPGGHKKWDFKAGAWVDSSPAIGSKGDLYFGSWDKKFYALKPDGTKEWEFPTGGPIVSSPAVSAEGLIYFGSHDGKFYALKPDGTKAWDYATGAPIISSPGINKDGTVYTTSVNGWFYALNPDGKLKWRLKTGGITESSPVIGQDDTIYVGANASLWFISQSGEKKHTGFVQPPFFSTPAILADGSGCFFSGGGAVYNAGSDSVTKWLFPEAYTQCASPAVDASGRILFGGYIKNTTSLICLPGSVPLASSCWPKFKGNPRNTGRMDKR